MGALKQHELSPKIKKPNSFRRKKGITINKPEPAKKIIREEDKKKPDCLFGNRVISVSGVGRSSRGSGIENIASSGASAWSRRGGGYRGR